MSLQRAYKYLQKRYIALFTVDMALEYLHLPIEMLLIVF